MTLSTYGIRNRQYANRHLADNAGSNRAEMSKPTSARMTASQTRAALDAKAREYYARTAGSTDQCPTVTGPDGHMVNQHR